MRNAFVVCITNLREVLYVENAKRMRKGLQWRRASAKLERYDRARSSVGALFGGCKTDARRRCRLIPVVKQTRIVGTVTDRDSAIRVAVGAERSPEAATIDPKQGLGGTTRKVVEGIST